MPLCFIPTPIGNLDDITIRALKALSKAEIVFCEDTRVTKKLFKLLSKKHNLEFLATEFTSLHSHNEEYKLNNLDIAIFNKNCIYVSDAGMPCISDPGAALIAYCQEFNVKYEVLPGASSVITAYAASGIAQTEFYFAGFLPQKEMAKKDRLLALLKKQEPSVIFESPHRLLDTLELLAKLEPDKIVFAAKELTKMHEKYYKEQASALYDLLKKQKILGEWVLILYPNKDGAEIDSSVFKPGMDKKSLSKAISKITGQDSKSIYAALTVNLG
jgi:16S rRNA (cytidine1402-2'-O)-methyltransferase